MTRAAQPLLAITMGDPAGIGPEVVLKALAHADVYERCRPLVLGRPAHPGAGRGVAWPDCLSTTSSRTRGWALSTPGTVTLLDMANAPPERCPVGQISAAAGRAAVEYVFRACDLAMAGAVDAVVTAPLNKAAMNLAGFAYAGHTELLTERTGAEQVSMLLVGPQLRIVHVSTHVALAEAIGRVTPRAGRGRSSWPTILPGAGHRRAADRGGRAEPACRRGRPVRRRGGASGSCRRSRAARARGWTSPTRSRPTRSFCAPPRAPTTSSSRCTTTRGTSQ